MTIGMQPYGLAEGIELRAAELIKLALHVECELRTTIAMLGVAPVIQSAAVVQEGKELYDEWICIPLACNRPAMVQHSGPVIGAVYALPVKHKLLLDMCEEAFAVVVVVKRTSSAHAP